MSEVKIKKAYAAIVEFLEQNVEATVSEVIENVREMAAAKTGSGGGKATTFHRDEATGEVVAIKCYYHGLWMDPRVADFGVKKTSASGFNSMCKDGSSKWNKQQAAVKKADAEILGRVADGTLRPDRIAAEQEKIKVEAKKVVPREDGYGFATLEECIADSAERGL